ncbi:MAG: MetQ/NlpA family ABC transporter substrate-binding protein, partial [Finegoldia magna]|nr:MetQ/NlpA family ABC transporter substrate-binding protein [Finegoldia magna]
MKKKILLVVLALALVLTSCSKKESKKEEGQSTDGKKVVIGVSPAPHKEIAEKAKEIVAKDGIELEIKEFDD